MLETVTVHSKVISKYFNPKVYKDSAELQYRQASTLLTRLRPSEDLCESMQVQLNMHKIEYWGGQIFQSSNFPMFFSPETIKFYEPTIKQTTQLYLTEQ